MAIAPWDFEELVPSSPRLRLIESGSVSARSSARSETRCRLQPALPAEDDDLAEAEVVPLRNVRPLINPALINPALINPALIDPETAHHPDAVARPRTASRLRPRSSVEVRRRRLLVGTLGAALVVLLALPLSALGGRPVTAAPKPLAGSTPGHPVTYVVQPGDTLWSIATRLAPGSDPRPLVAEMEARLGSATVEPGERIVLPT